MLSGDSLVGPREAQRLVALYQLDVLDSPSSECFERVVRLAARLFEVPVARIALVDAVREWCLAGQGELPVEVPREQSFADHVVRFGDLLVVEDATTSLSLFEHPLVVGEPGVRFLAGCPLRSASGAIVGALYVLGPKPRSIGAADRQMLRDLGGVADDELATRANRCFDEGTGLLLRRGLDIVGGHVVSRAHRRGEQISMLVVDIDTSPPPRRLRAVGAVEVSAPAPAGSGSDLEATVAIVAEVVSGVTRSSDIPARLPCDELVVLLPDTDQRRCLHVARRVAEEVERATADAGCAPVALQLAAATIDGSREQVSVAALLRRAEPLDLDLVRASSASSGGAEPS